MTVTNYYPNNPFTLEDQKDWARSVVDLLAAYSKSGWLPSGQHKKVS